MDEGLSVYLTGQLEDAIKCGDNNALQRAQTSALIAMVDCQYKTSRRVKDIECFIQKSKWFAKAIYAIGGIAGYEGVTKLLEIFTK